MKKWAGMQNGAFITRDDGTWYQRHDGSQQYETTTCTLKRFMAEEARTCLASHHVLLIGDSIQRYLFLGLVYLIEHGSWAPRFPMSSTDPKADPSESCLHKDVLGEPTCSPPGDPSVLSENDWGFLYGHAPEKSWKQMHVAIGGKAFNGNMDCQCARLDPERSTENMFYSSADNSIKLSFLSNVGTYPVHWWNRTRSKGGAGCSDDSSCDLTPAAWDELQKRAEKEDWDTVGSIADLLRPDAATGESAVSKLLPDVDIALFNRGAWGKLGEDEGKRIMEGLFALTQQAGRRKGQEGRCYWRSNFPMYSGGPHWGYAFEGVDEDIERAAYSSGCGVFHASHVTRSWAHFQWSGDVGRASCCGEKEMLNIYFDAVHMRPWVNEELNNILLNVLC